MREMPMDLEQAGATTTVGRPDAAAARAWGGLWSFCRRKPLGAVSGLVILVMIVTAIFAELIAPNDPVKPFIGSSFAGAGHTPAQGHIMLLGADAPGRDLFARLVFGARISLLVGVGSVAIGVLAGTLLGLVSAYYGGKLDLIVQRLVDGLMAFPALVLALVIVTLMGKGLVVGGAQANVVLSIGIILIPVTARVVRASALSVQENAYVDAARALGARDGRIIVRHILPNVTHAVIILGATYLGAAILLEASLSFLGQGTDINRPSWGNMLSGSRAAFEAHPRLLWAPAIAISVVVLAFNLLGDALRDVWDPRLRNT